MENIETESRTTLEQPEEEKISVRNNDSVEYEEVIDNAAMHGHFNWWNYEHEDQNHLFTNGAYSSHVQDWFCPFGDHLRYELNNGIYEGRDRLEKYDDFMDVRYNRDDEQALDDPLLGHFCLPDQNVLLASHIPKQNSAIILDESLCVAGWNDILEFDFKAQLTPIFDHHDIGS